MPRMEPCVHARFLNADPAEGLLSAGVMEKDERSIHSGPHCLPYYSGFLLLSGSGEYRDERTPPRTLRPGDYVHRFPKWPHTTLVNPGTQWKEIYLTFGTGLFVQLNALGLMDLQQPVVHPGIDDGLLARMTNYLEAVPDMQVPNDRLLLMAMEIHVHVRTLCRAGCEEQPLEQRLQMLLRMPENRRRPLPELAGLLGMDYRRFRQRLSEETGHSPMEAVQRFRMHLAHELLADRGLSVTEVAVRIGYADVFTFSKQFRRLMGMTPSEYRTRMFV